MKLGRLTVILICLLAGMAHAQAAPAQEQASPSPKGKQKGPAVSNIPRPAPEFLWASVNGKVKRLKDVLGQPVVLIFATTPEQKEFKKHVGVDLAGQEFWRAMIRSQGPKRRPPKRTKVAAPVADDEEDDGE